MKQLILICVGMFSFNTLFSQVDTLYNSNHPFTFVWSNTDLVNFDSVKSIPSSNGVIVETSQLYGDTIKFYKMSDGSGFVMTENLKPDSSLVYRFVMPPLPNPCEMADYWALKYESSGSAVSLDNHRKWFVRCINKEY